MRKRLRKLVPPAKRPCPACCRRQGFRRPDFRRQLKAVYARLLFTAQLMLMQHVAFVKTELLETQWYFVLCISPRQDRRPPSRCLFATPHSAETAGAPRGGEAAAAAAAAAAPAAGKEAAAAKAPTISGQSTVAPRIPAAKDRSLTSMVRACSRAASQPAYFCIAGVTRVTLHPKP